jgi:hypothetical protein
MAPLHAPDAVQEPASVELQLSMESPPKETVEGLAEMNTVGTGAAASTVIVADADADPPAPVQEMV